MVEMCFRKIDPTWASSVTHRQGTKKKTLPVAVRIRNTTSFLLIINIRLAFGDHQQIHICSVIHYIPSEQLHIFSLQSHTV
jgi:hypothetical protein